MSKLLTKKITNSIVFSFLSFFKRFKSILVKDDRIKSEVCKT